MRMGRSVSLTSTNATIAPQVSRLTANVARTDLALQLTLADAEGPTTGFPPWLLPGSYVDLPLNESSDPVDGAFAALGAASLMPLGDREARVNPGEAWMFETRLENSGSATATYNVALRVAGAAWARLISSSSVEVAPGGDAIVRVAVEVPEDARDAERADIVLDVSTKGEDATRSLLRYVVIVDVEGDHEDQSSRIHAESRKGFDVPGPSIVLFATALLTGVVLRRRA